MSETKPVYMLSLAELGDVTNERPMQIAQKFESSELISNGRIICVPPDLVREYFTKKQLADYDFKVLAFVNLKGGVGKTTSAISIATRAAEYGYKVCLLDMDSQGSASVAFNIEVAADEPIFADVWERPQEMVMPSLRKIQEGLWILPSSLDNAMLDTHLADPAAQKAAVKGVCEVLKQNGVDLVLIDCPPSLGAAVISSIRAADVIVMPVGHDRFALRGLQLTFDEITAICKAFKIRPPEARILYTKFDLRIKLSRLMFDKLQQQHPEKVMPVPIRTSSLYAQATNKFKTVFAYAGRSTAKEDYDLCTRYLLGIGKM